MLTSLQGTQDGISPVFRKALGNQAANTKGIADHETLEAPFILKYLFIL